jgi:ribosomal protein S18 acetylase RimI-like enzyme
MKTLSPLSRAIPTVRWMVHMDLPQVVRIARQEAGLQWTSDDFLTALRAINTVGQVVEIDRTVAGFAIYKIQREPGAVELDEVERFESGPAKSNRFPLRPLQIEIVNLAVAPEMQRQGIGRTMLYRLDQKIQREGGCIQALVPETNLAMQLFLRAAGYRATGVLRNHDGGEDAYLMERWSNTSEVSKTSEVWG